MLPTIIIPRGPDHMSETKKGIDEIHLSHKYAQGLQETKSEKSKPTHAEGMMAKPTWSRND